MPSTQRFKINSDIPLKIKQYLVEYSENRNVSLSSFLSERLSEYIRKGGQTSLSGEILNQYDSLDGVGRNNLTFWSPESLKKEFDNLCNENIRNAKQQSKHFIYSLYHELIVNETTLIS